MKVLLGAALAIVCGAGLSFFLPTPPYSAFAATSIILGSIVFIAYSKQILDVVFSNPVLVAYLAWSFATILWSTSVLQSLSTSLAVAAGLAIAGGFIVKCGILGSAKLILIVLTALCVLSYLLVWVEPSSFTIWVNHPSAGSIEIPTGLFTWNSSLGIAAAIAGVLALGLRMATKNNWYLAPFLINSYFCFEALSVTSLFAWAAGVVCVVIVRYKVPRVIAFVFAPFIALAYLFGTMRNLFETILASVSRSSDLTQRSEIWEVTSSLSAQKRWHGWGAGTQPDFYSELERLVDHAHNGYLAVAYDRGLIGLALLLVTIGVAVFQVVRRGSSTAILVLPVVATVLIANLGNAYYIYLGAGSLMLYWAILVAATSATDEPSREALTPSRESEYSRTKSQLEIS